MITPIPTAQTQRAGGVSWIVEVTQDVFVDVLQKMERPLVLAVRAGFPKAYKYLTRYQGYHFMVRSKEPLDFSRQAEVVSVKKIHTSTEWVGL